MLRSRVLELHNISHGSLVQEYRDYGNLKVSEWDAGAGRLMKAWTGELSGSLPTGINVVVMNTSLFQIALSDSS